MEPPCVSGSWCAVWIKSWDPPGAQSLPWRTVPALEMLAVIMDITRDPSLS